MEYRWMAFFLYLIKKSEFLSYRQRITLISCISCIYTTGERSSITWIDVGKIILQTVKNTKTKRKVWWAVDEDEMEAVNLFCDAKIEQNATKVVFLSSIRSKFYMDLKWNIARIEKGWRYRHVFRLKTMQINSNSKSKMI